MTARACLSTGPMLLVCVLVAGLAKSQSLPTELSAEHDPARRVEKALGLAESAFDIARTAYSKDDVHKGDAELEEMTVALDDCLSSLGLARKSRLYKKAEIKVSYLQRRMQSLLEEIAASQRGWAEQTDRKLEEIHAKLLEGAMRK